jgi:hypothetical protein
MAEFDKATEEFERWNKTLDQQADKWRKVLDPTLVYYDKLTEITNLIKTGKLTPEEGDAAWLTVNEELRKVVDNLNPLAKKNTEVFDEMKHSVEGWGRSFSQTMAEAMLTGTLTADKIKASFMSLVAELMAVQLQKQIMSPFIAAGAGFLSSYFNVGGAANAPVPTASLGSRDGVTQDHDGGLAGEGTPRTVPAGTFDNARRMHNGGIAANEVPTILERGEEVLTRKDPRHRYNQGGGAGSMNVKVSIENQSSQPSKVADATASFDVDGIVVRVILKDLHDEGPVSQALARKSASGTY